MGPVFAITTVASHFTTDEVMRLGRRAYIRDVLCPCLIEVVTGAADYMYIPVLLADLVIPGVYLHESQMIVNSATGSLDFLILVTDPNKAGIWYSQFQLLLANRLPACKLELDD